MPARAYSVAEKSKNYQYSTNYQVVIDDSLLVVVVGQPAPGNRNDCKAWALSGAGLAGQDVDIHAGGDSPPSRRSAARSADYVGGRSILRGPR